VVDEGEPDGIAAELAGVEARYRAKLEAAEAKYQERLKTYEWRWFREGSRDDDGFYVPLGPEQAAQECDNAVRATEEEYDRAVERIERRPPGRSAGPRRGLRPARLRSLREAVPSSGMSATPRGTINLVPRFRSPFR
jgi:hypothetical protein